MKVQTENPASIKFGDKLLPELILYKFLFNFEFLEDALLPVFKGSTIRGAFGWELLKSVEGLYPVFEKIFATKGDENNPEVLKGVKEIPHPFILHPPVTTKRNFSRGELFTVGVTLFGYSHNFLPSFIDAFALMAQSGITSKRSRLRLINVINEGPDQTNYLIYGNGSSKTKYKEILLNDIIKNINYRVNKIKLKFETPFLLRYKDVDILEKDKNKITPNLITARLEARYRTLSQLYCRSTSDVKEIFRPDDSVKISSLDVGHYEMPRRNQKFMGLSGSITLEGNLMSILPLLYIGEKINIGNRSSFGWGQYKIEILDKGL